MIPASEMLLRWLVRLLIPLMVLVGGYLLWLGKFAPGGAFQAGVLLAAAGVLLWLAGFKSIAGVPETMLRLLLLVGFGGFLIAAVGTVLAGRLMLDFPEEIAGLVILLVETAATVSIAATLTALLIGLQPACSERPAQKPAP